MSDAASIAGWHGKLPTLGDFATRRLDPGFVEVWDAWLSAGLAAMRAQPNWLDAYLASPSWRFLLMPGVLPGELGERAWAGVLMPSVDRVGRYYPLTLVCPLDSLPSSGEPLETLWRWLLQLEEAAADALHDDWDVETLEAELARIGVPLIGTVPMAAEPLPTAAWQALPLAGPRHAAAQLAGQAAALWAARMSGQAYWYAESGLAMPLLLQSAGLVDAVFVGRLMAPAGEIDPPP